MDNSLNMNAFETYAYILCFQLKHNLYSSILLAFCCENQVLTGDSYTFQAHQALQVLAESSLSLLDDKILMDT